jgi:hypothetical protein
VLKFEEGLPSSEIRESKRNPAYEKDIKDVEDF